MKPNEKEMEQKDSMAGMVAILAIFLGKAPIYRLNAPLQLQHSVSEHPGRPTSI